MCQRSTAVGLHVRKNGVQRVYRGPSEHFGLVLLRSRQHTLISGEDSLICYLDQTRHDWRVRDTRRASKLAWTKPRGDRNSWCGIRIVSQNYRSLGVVFLCPATFGKLDAPILEALLFRL